MIISHIYAVVIYNYNIYISQYSILFYSVYISQYSAVCAYILFLIHVHVYVHVFPYYISIELSIFSMQQQSNSLFELL